MTLRARLVGIAALSVGALLAFALACALKAADDLHRDVVQVRDTHLLQTVQGSAESRLAIGLAPDGLDGLQALIEREKAAVPEVLSIDLYDVKGALLYSTDRSAIGLKVPPAWVERLSVSQAWQLDGPSERTVGLRADNDIGEAALGVAVTLADTPVPNDLNAWVGWGPDGVWRGVPAEGSRRALLAGVCLALAALTIAFGCARLLSPWGRVKAALLGLPAPEGAGLSGALEQTARERREAWAIAEREVDQCLAELRAMDDAG